MSNKVKVRIYGSEYTIIGTESEEYIQNVAYMVDRKMREISVSASLKPMRASVLTSLNICDEYLKAKDKLEQLSLQIKELSDENAALKLEKCTLEEEKRFLKDEIQSHRRNSGK